MLTRKLKSTSGVNSIASDRLKQVTHRDAGSMGRAASHYLSGNNGYSRNHASKCRKSFHLNYIYY